LRKRYLIKDAQPKEDTIWTQVELFQKIIDEYFKENYFKKCLFEHAIYVKSRKEDTLIVILHVDDIIFYEK
jgi:hypothetical protein